MATAESSDLGTQAKGPGLLAHTMYAFGGDMSAMIAREVQGIIMAGNNGAACLKGLAISIVNGEAYESYMSAPAAGDYWLILKMGKKDANERALVRRVDNQFVIRPDLELSRCTEVARIIVALLVPQTSP